MDIIDSSELILNPDGSVYHLGVKPDELSPIIITVGDPDRVPMVSKYFDEIFLKVNRRELVTHTGRIGNQNVSVVSTGMGTDNIDIVFNELDALFNIDFETRTVKDKITSLKIIRLGTSGAIHHDIPLDSIIASEYAIGYDGLLGFYEIPAHRFSDIQVPNLGDAKGYVVPGSELLLNTIGRDYIKGVTYTAAGFYAPQGRILRAKVTQPDILHQLLTIQLPLQRKITNIEMETSGLYGLGHALGHEVISISALVANRIDGTFSQNPEQTVIRMIEESLAKIEEI
ncbi:MAG TPA: nucleoside phosphorylase [Chitinophagales bacterium]|nr:nucleoside phosphorylase [Chitinophagales bacterium]